MLPNDLILAGRRTLLQEAEALRAFVDQLGESFAQAAETLFACSGTVILTGMGKSGIVARKWSSTFSSTGTKSYFLNPAEAPHGDFGILRAGDVLVALSQSGETRELSFVLRHAREMGLTCVGVTGNPESSLARQAAIVLPVIVAEEACPLGLAPTTSTTLMMALGDAMAVTLMQMRGFTEKDFARFHPGGSLGRKLWLRVAEIMHRGEALPVVRQGDSFGQVLLEMTRKRLGLAVVLEGEEILGVVTDGDLRRYLQAPRGSRFDEVTARDLMSRNPKSISSKALAVEAREMMEANSIHQLLIVEEGKLAGVVHLHDLLRMKVL